MKKLRKKKLNIEQLLDRQTETILTAVDEKLSRLEKRVGKLETSMEELKNTLDQFLKRLTDFSDEFKIVKARLDKVEQILKEKLGVEVKL